MSADDIIAGLRTEVFEPAIPRGAYRRTWFEGEVYATAVELFCRVRHWHGGKALWQATLPVHGGYADGEDILVVVDNLRDWLDGQNAVAGYPLGRLRHVLAALHWFANPEEVW